MADVAMPRLSDSMEEGTILKWLKSDGGEISRGDELVEIETDKANMTYEADESGALQIVAKEGDTLAVGETIATIGGGSGKPAEDAGGEQEPAAEEAEPEEESADDAPPPDRADVPTAEDSAPESAQLVASIGMTPGQPPLADRIPADKREALSKLVASSGVPAPYLDQLETWAAAIMLAGISFDQAGFSPDSGVETELTQTYKRANKPIGALETIEQQLHGFLWNRKHEYAVLIVETLALDRIPRPLDRVLAHALSG